MKKAVGYALGIVGVGAVVGVGMRLVEISSSYAVPTEMCGLAAPSSLEPLLPGGDEIEVRDEDVSSAANALKMCRFVVDRDDVLTTVVMQRTMGTSVAERYREFGPTYGFVGFETTLGGEPAVLGQGGSLVQVPCPGRGDGASLEINVRSYAAGERGYEEDERNVRAFTEDLIPLYSDEYGCG